MKTTEDGCLPYPSVELRQDDAEQAAQAPAGGPSSSDHARASGNLVGAVFVKAMSIRQTARYERDPERFPLQPAITPNDLTDNQTIKILRGYLLRCPPILDKKCSFEPSANLSDGKSTSHRGHYIPSRRGSFFSTHINQQQVRLPDEWRQFLLSLKDHQPIHFDHHDIRKRCTGAKA